MQEPFKVTHRSEIPTPAPPGPGEGQWKSLRHHFGIEVFGGAPGEAFAVSPWKQRWTGAAVDR